MERLIRHPHRGLGCGDLVIDDGVPVRLMRVSRLGPGYDDGCTITSDGLSVTFRFVEARFERAEVLADLTEFENMPAVGAKACGGVVAEGTPSRRRW